VSIPENKKGEDEEEKRARAGYLTKNPKAVSLRPLFSFLLFAVASDILLLFGESEKRIES